MELLYLWVEKYNNIEKQGFNFSSKYKFDYKNGELTCEENSNCVGDGFFGDNITNITAIIGKNGSGKSSVLDFISELSIGWKIPDDDNLKSKEFIMVIEKDNKEKTCLYYLGDKVILKTKFCILEQIKPYEIEEKSKYLPKYNFEKIINKVEKNLQMILYSHTIDRDKRSSNIIDNNNFINISTNFLLKNAQNEDDKISEYEKKEYLKEIEFFYNNYKKFILFKLPEKIDVSINTDLLMNDYPVFVKDEKDKEIKNDFIELGRITELSNKINNYVDKKINEIDNNKTKYKLQFVRLVLNVVAEKYRNNVYYDINSIDVIDNGKDEIEKLKEVLEIIIEKNKLEKENLEKLKKIREKYKDKINENSNIEKDIYKFSDEEWKIIEYFKIRKGMEFRNRIDTDKDIARRIEKLNKIKEFIDYVIKIVEKIKEENINLRFVLSKNENELNYDVFREFIEKYYGCFSDNYEYPIFTFEYNRILSTGEQKILSIFSRFYHLKNENKLNTKNIIFILDEPDIYMHPEWQRKFLSMFIEFIKNAFNDQKVQIIVTSHSPFVISDLPRENVIFLEKDDDGKCKVVESGEKKKTFGANVHTLLSEGFFMESTLGEFARSKISEVIQILGDKEFRENKNKEYIEKNKDNKDDKVLFEDYIKNVIKMIGEPLIRTKLNKMYDITYPEKSKDRIADIEKLKSEIEKLEEKSKNPKDYKEALEKIKEQIEGYQNKLENNGEKQ